MLYDCMQLQAWLHVSRLFRIIARSHRHPSTKTRYYTFATHAYVWLSSFGLQATHTDRKVMQEKLQQMHNVGLEETRDTKRQV